jgi:hypothetical protein
MRDISIGLELFEVITLLFIRLLLHLYNKTSVYFSFLSSVAVAEAVAEDSLFLSFLNLRFSSARLTEINALEVKKRKLTWYTK